MLSIVSSSGCYNTIPETGRLINNRTIFLIVVEAGHMRSGFLHVQVLVRVFLQVTDCHLFVVISRSEKRASRFSGLFVGGH